MSGEDLERWEHGFDSGVALRDPRVQAFCAGCAERTFEVADAFQRKTVLLSRYLEAPACEIALQRIGLGGRPVFGYYGEVFLALTDAEVAAVDAETDRVPLVIAGAENVPGPVERYTFNGHVIFQWSSA